MNEQILPIQYLSPKLGEEIPAPIYQTEGSAGMDCCACIDEPIVLNPKERIMVPLGFKVAIPPGFVGLIFARSGLGTKHGITLPNCVGVIDSDYRGEVKCALTNIGDTSYTVLPGDRICQMVILPYVKAALKQTEIPDDTERGAGGFGSTGLN